MWLYSKYRVHRNSLAIRRKLRWQAGDTIVEVLIAIAIVSYILTGAYTLTSTTTHATQDAQERSEAMQLLQGQVELMRSNIAKHPGNYVGSSAPTLYCLSSSNIFSAITVHDLPALANDDFSEYNPLICKVSGRYYISIQYDSATSDTFTFRARWDKIGGGKDEVKYIYRAHKPIPTEPPLGSVPGPSPPAPAPAGDAAIGGTCDVNPDGCADGADTPRYFYFVYKYNLSQNNGVPADSCDWDWGDGIHTFDHCENDGQYNKHCYAAALAGNKTSSYTINLTIHLHNGTTAYSNPVPVLVPTRLTNYGANTACSSTTPPS